jgi:hypothetical protein
MTSCPGRCQAGKSNSWWTKQKEFNIRSIETQTNKTYVKWM